MKRTVLISEPCNESPYYPYMWGVLKSYSEVVAGLAGELHWLDPIYLRTDDYARDIDERARGTPVDVFGLSCYIWNWDYQLGLARAMKQRNPDCLVVAGGPHPEYKDRDFFRKHPEIDIVVVRDGEIPFSKILARFCLEGKREFDDIPGLVLRDEHGGPRSTGEARVPQTFPYSPWIVQTAFYEKLVAERGPGFHSAVWETNRGCPYSCRFCDWGSSTMSKIRLMDLDRLRAEVDWFARTQTEFVFNVDANFGILARDVQLTDWVIAAFERHGYPRSFNYSAAKNNPERSVQIGLKLAASGLRPGHALGIQHTDPEVLAATDRRNISFAKQMKAAKELKQQGIIVVPQVIMGMPGDTYEKWKTCLATVMSCGMHDHFLMYPYQLLPNAPAADPAYLGEWQIETVDRLCWTHRHHGGKREEGDSCLNRYKLVVGSKTYSKDDWVRVCVFSAFIRTLHNASITRLVALYLHHTHRVGYKQFYDLVVDEFWPQSPVAWMAEALTRHFRGYVGDPDHLPDMRIEQWPNWPYRVEPSTWLFAQVGMNLDEVFAQLSAFLCRRFPHIANLASALDYQKNLVVVPTYDASVGRSFRCERDWGSYFSLASSCAGDDVLPEPAELRGGVVRIIDDGGEKGVLPGDKNQDEFYQRGRWDWTALDPEHRWIRWLERVGPLNYASGVRSNYQVLEVVDPALGALVRLERTRRVALRTVS